MVKAYRDTWHLGLHSYLSYLARSADCREGIATDSGSIFVQISDENLHRITNLLDEVFGMENQCGVISFAKTTSTATNLMSQEFDYLVWYAKDRTRVKYRQLYREKKLGTFKSYKYIEDASELCYRGLTEPERTGEEPLPEGAKLMQISNIAAQDPGPPDQRIFTFEGKEYDCGASKHWKTNPVGLNRLASAIGCLAWRRSSISSDFLTTTLRSHSATYGTILEAQGTRPPTRRCMLSKQIRKSLHDAF